MQKVLPDFCNDLVVRHFIDCFHAHDVSMKFHLLKSFFKFNFRLAWTEYQNRFRIANM